MSSCEQASAIISPAPDRAAMGTVIGFDPEAMTVDIVSFGAVHDDTPCLFFGGEGLEPDFRVGMPVLLVARGTKVVAIAVDWAEFAERLVGDDTIYFDEKTSASEILLRVGRRTHAVRLL